MRCVLTANLLPKDNYHVSIHPGKGNAVGARAVTSEEREICRRRPLFLRGCDFLKGLGGNKKVRCPGSEVIRTVNSGQWTVVSGE